MRTVWVVEWVRARDGLVLTLESWTTRAAAVERMRDRRRTVSPLAIGNFRVAKYVPATKPAKKGENRRG
jgi:hypothetical protein